MGGYHLLMFSYNTKCCEGLIVPWQEIQQLGVMPFDRLVKLVLTIVELFTDGPSGKAIHSGVTFNLMIVRLQLDSTEGCRWLHSRSWHRHSLVFVFDCSRSGCGS